MQLCIKQYGTRIQNLKNIFRLISFRFLIMYFRNDAYVGFIPAQRDKYTHPSYYLSLQRLWNRIGKHPVERQREYNVCEQGLEVIGESYLPSIHFGINLITIVPNPLTILIHHNQITRLIE